MQFEMIGLVALLVAVSLTVGHTLDLDIEKSFYNRILEKRLGNLEHAIYEMINQPPLVEQLFAKPMKNRLIQSCDEVDASGRYRLQLPEGSIPFGVICEAQFFEGGWLVIQQRVSAKLSFDQDWEAYRKGFGVVGSASSFWLGLEKIHQITSDGDYELAVELRDENGTYGYALHSNFKIAGEEDFYALTCSGTEAGIMDGRIAAGDGKKFSAKDADFDKLENINCGEHYKSGWWFYDCNNVNLNGPFIKDESTGRGIYWRGFTNAATYSRMMIRRK